MFRAEPIPLSHEPGILRHVLGGPGCFEGRGADSLGMEPSRAPSFLCQRADPET
jgi:hypothetical protein